MKKLIVLVLIIGFSKVEAQNLIKNPGFEQHINNGFGCTPGSSIGFSNIFDTITPNDCGIKDWIRISETPDGYWNKGHDFPKNYHSNNIYPHSDSVCVGAFYMFHGFQGGQTTREIVEGKLTKPLITNHHYQFSMYVQLFDTIDGNTIDIGKIVGVNSFSAVFTDTIIPSHNYLPITNYKPQVQINQMVIDTQHWVLLVDTFIAAGGEQFVSIGNFKPDSLIQYQLVDSIRNLAIASYYYMDDVSLIDLDDTASGVEEQLAVKSGQLVVYPNPAKESIVVSSKSLVNTIEVRDVLGRVVIQQIKNSSAQQIQIDVSGLSSGIYFIKATDDEGNSINGKFVKE
ncbi:MAG: hypothetical protein RJA07_2203 [Bacteroidota bacterium]|jgi:hypothetical protein